MKITLLITRCVGLLGPLILASTISSLLAGPEATAPQAAITQNVTGTNWFTSSILHPDDPFVPVPGKDPNGWNFELMPYGWAPGVYGTIGIKDFPVSSVNASPIQVLQKLDWGVFMHAEVQKGRWGILADGFYAQFSASISPSGPLYQSATAKLSQSMDSLEASFRVIDTRKGFVDLYAGARYYYQGVGINADVNPAFARKAAIAGQLITTVTGRQANLGLPTNLFQDRPWVDPLVGLRGRINLTHWLYLAAQGDAGGFDVGSQIAWFTQANLGVNITRNAVFEAGYRYMYIDYNKGGFLYQVNMPGVYAGLGFRF